MKNNKPTRRVRKAYANALVKYNKMTRENANLFVSQSRHDSASMIKFTRYHCTAFTPNHEQ